MEPIEIIDFPADSPLPRCPYCQQELDRVGKYKHGSTVEHHILVCPYCATIIGYSATK